YERLRSNETLTLDEFREHTGKGGEGRMDRRTIKVGSAAYVGGETQGDSSLTEVYVSADDTLKGRFVFNNSYREGLSGVFGELERDMALGILSGDNDGERNRLEKLLPPGTRMLFNQRPQDKLDHIKALQGEHRVLMVGDGLNDA